MTCWMINGAVYIINDKYYNSLIFQHNVDLVLVLVLTIFNEGAYLTFFIFHY